jgi:hypothetical protein
MKDRGTGKEPARPGVIAGCLWSDPLATSGSRAPEWAQPILNQLEIQRLAPHGRLWPITEKVDTGTMTDISMRTADGIARPFFIPGRIAYRIVMALRREHLHPADQIDGTPVP